MIAGNNDDLECSGVVFANCDVGPERLGSTGKPFQFMRRRGRETFFGFSMESDLFGDKVGGLRNQDLDDSTDVDRDIGSTHFGRPVAGGKPYAGMSRLSGRIGVTKPYLTACE